MGKQVGKQWGNIDQNIPSKTKLNQFFVFYKIARFPHKYGLNRHSAVVPAHPIRDPVGIHIELRNHQYLLYFSSF